ncbi:uncharacterized protein LOC113040326 [Carassius auratus]|uniref:Uncharacterized protein LOC113040326 n=1 Tax=Carassius auratus TaxID=7957 RepID=A0A6P6J2Q9_CARAU|nr:uncharacterized protein LOC113040326 [Carassius auratus]
MAPPATLAHCRVVSTITSVLQDTARPVQPLLKPCSMCSHSSQCVIICGSDTASVSWAASSGLVSYYTVTAVDDNGRTLTSNSNRTSCDISGLSCGQAYNVSVTAMSVDCTGQRSEVRRISTAPCDPQNITTVLQCDTNTANVTWAVSAGANGYTAIATDRQQQRLASCHSMGTSCQLTSLPCGMRLNVTVQADGTTCNSSSQPKAVVETAPCIPTSVAAALNCTSNIASITWYSALGATWYLVKAESSQGYKTSCNNTVTQCDIPNLQCGQEYSITVMGMNGVCMGPASQPITLVSAPCHNTGIQASLDCRSNSALISWTPGNGSLSFNATLQSLQDPQKHNCFTNGSSCNIGSLPCGQHYNICITGYGQTCSTSSKALVTLDTAPCVPTQVNVSLSCGSDTASVSWTASSGLVSYYTVTAIDDNGRTLTSNSNRTSCDISGLSCGQAYNVSVTAMSVDCTGQRSEVRRISTAPCAPQSVVSQLLDCRTGDVQISWQSSKGAQIYYAQAKSTVKTLVCNSTSTSCIIPAICCGQTHTITVVAVANSCSSNTSVTSQVTAGPCVPQNVSASVSCSSNIASVTWGSTQGAELYTVTASSANGLSANCTSTSTSCNLPTLTCGQSYTITVKAKGSNCSSGNSAPVQVQAVPCTPSNVLPTMDCVTNALVVSWTPGAGGQYYTATLQDSNGLSTTCQSTGSQCNVTGLRCGQLYHINVTASDGLCSSPPSATVNTNSAPCLSTSVSAVVDCATDSVLVSWSSIAGAENYSVTALGSGGQRLSCSTSQNNCNMSSLQCDQQFNLTFTSTNQQCQMTSATNVTFQSRPCAPLQPEVSKLCGNKMSVMSWDLREGAGYYIARAVSAVGGYQLCNSTNSVCTFSTLGCGETYTFSVTAHRDRCQSDPSAPVYLTTDPCKPENVTANVSCDSETAAFNWSKAKGASFYTVMAIGSLGYIAEFNTTSTNLSVPLLCGQSYNVFVEAHNIYCESPPSTAAVFRLAPCPPQNVSAVVQCDLGSVLVSWNPAVDAGQFRVELESQRTGAISSCISTNTQCSIAHLPCGERFNLSVVALGGSCQSQPSSNLSISSAPCIPQGVTGTVDCVTNSAWVSWDVDNGAESYTVLAVRDDGHNTTCSSSNTTCNVADLGCGRSYTFNVTASSAACVSPPSNSFQLETAPCALSSIVVVAKCNSSVIMVQWQRAQSVKSLYIATAVDQDRSLLSCNSSTSSCNLTNVQCDKEYTIIVAASANQCSSLRSPPYKIRTAPCPPSSVQANVDCQSKDAFVSWDPSYVATSYLLTAVGRYGDLKTCNTSDNNCTLSDLRCSNTYYVSVSASNKNCTSLPSANITFQTVPCGPANLTANILCGNSSSASLSWARSTGAVVYRGLAQSETGTTFYCETPNTFCTLEGLVCGTVYNFTVQATDGLCNSSLSEPQTKGAAPCPPTGFRVVPRTVVNDTQILRASWSTVNCPNSEYLLALTGSIQGNSQGHFDLASYWTSRRFFEVPLPCGSAYSATISARNSAATSDKSAAITGTTVPCAPLNVTFSASLAKVGWNESLLATNYTVYGVTSSGRTKLCMTSMLLCSVTNFSSGQIVVTASNTAGESGDSVPVSVTAVRRRR